MKSAAPSTLVSQGNNACVQFACISFYLSADGAVKTLTDILTSGEVTGKLVISLSDLTLSYFAHYLTPSRGLSHVHSRSDLSIPKKRLIKAPSRMKMSWLFGKKKHKDSPPESRDEHEERPPADPGDDFIVIEKRRTSLPPDVAAHGSPYSSGLYPFIGGTPLNPTMSAGNLPKLTQQADAPPYLSGVPFKLCKQLQSNMNNDLEIDGLRISEIMSFVERLENQNYDYDFSLEMGVISEMDSRTND